MTKTPKLKLQIEYNREIITNMLSGVTTTKRLNNLNWLRHEISYTEPRTLFYIPNKEQQPYLDFNCMRNLGTAYDYVTHHTDAVIDENAISKIHQILCRDTYIDGGVFRTTGKVLEIMVDGNRVHAPDAGLIRTEMSQIIYKLNNSSDCVLNRAFNIHYDLIALQPFDDFNKRTARMVMNWVLVQGGYRPIVFNKPSDKQKYKAAITACASGDRKAYNAYMESCLVRTQKEIISVLTKSKMI